MEQCRAYKSISSGLILKFQLGDRGVRLRVYIVTRIDIHASKKKNNAMKKHFNDQIFTRGLTQIRHLLCPHLT